MKKSIEIQNINKSFKDFKALDNLSLNVSAGEIYGLLGSNGAGKSTTINVLLGFIKPDSGEAYINGINVISNYTDSRNNIAYIPENINLYPYLTGIENLDYFSKLSGKNHSYSFLQKLLKKSGLPDEVHNKPVEFYSKGMRQKVGISIAIAKEAKVLLLDEPASGLDPLASNELSVLLKQLSKEGSTILMASHDIFRTRETCNRIGIIKNGKLIEEMHSSNVSTNELEKIYINYMQN
jgi:ABC-2 type transport system ATP-binding protein